MKKIIIGILCVLAIAFMPTGKLSPIVGTYAEATLADDLGAAIFGLGIAVALIVLGIYSHLHASRTAFNTWYSDTYNKTVKEQAKDVQGNVSDGSETKKEAKEAAGHTVEEYDRQKDS